MKHSLLLAALLLPLIACCQSKHYSAIGIGEKLPLMGKRSIYNNAPGMSIDLEKYKGKWLILDFWGVHCSSCIDAFPKLGQLQQQFKGKLQIVMVTANTKEQVNKLFTHVKRPDPTIPIIVDDVSLQQVFPHESEPHHVWIAPDGTVKYITQGYNATAKNIQSVMDGKQIGLILKSDIADVNYQRRLVQYDQLQSPDFYEGYSVLLHGLSSSVNEESVNFFKDSVSGMTTRISAINVPLFRLYGTAFNGLLYKTDINPLYIDHYNRSILEIRDTTPFYFEKDSSKLDEWLKKNKLSYELQLTPGDTTDIIKRMQEDLDRMLPYHASIEKRMIKTWSLVRSSTFNLYSSKDTPDKPSCEFRGTGLFIRNTPIHASLYKWLVILLQSLPEPIIDDTGDATSIDLDLTADFNDFNALKKELNKIGLDLVEKQQETEMLVIKDKL